MVRELICGAAPRVLTQELGWTCYICINEFVLALPRSAVVIEGCAKGADSMAARAALRRGMEVIHVPAHWSHDPRQCDGVKQYCTNGCDAPRGRSAGMIRNATMLRFYPDHVTAFHNDLANSKGTKGMVALAHKAGIPVEVRTCPHR